MGGGFRRGGFFGGGSRRGGSFGGGSRRGDFFGGGSRRGGSLDGGSIGPRGFGLRGPFCCRSSRLSVNCIVTSSIRVLTRRSLSHWDA